MLKIDNQQISFTDYLIPEELTTLDDDLSMIDEYLNDDRIVQPFIEHFHKKHGRPSTPLQVYLRMMYIKRMYSFSYEILQQRVSDSIKWRRFCHIPLDEHDLFVRAWGIGNTDLMKKAYDAGVDGMTIDFPDRLLDYIAKGV
jgi:hypothetical protein